MQVCHLPFWLKTEMNNPVRNDLMKKRDLAQAQTTGNQGTAVVYAGWRNMSHNMSLNSNQPQLPPTKV